MVLQSNNVAARTGGKVITAEPAARHVAPSPGLVHTSGPCGMPAPRVDPVLETHRRSVLAGQGWSSAPGERWQAGGIAGRA